METLVHELMWDTNAQDLLKRMISEEKNPKAIQKNKKEHEGHEI